jgi:hypothetical protein
VSLPGKVDVPFTVTGLRHCVCESGSLTTIGDFTGAVLVVAVVADCLEDEQAVAPRTSRARAARRATSP